MWKGFYFKIYLHKAIEYSDFFPYCVSAMSLDIQVSSVYMPPVTYSWQSITHYIVNNSPIDESKSLNTKLQDLKIKFYKSFLGILSNYLSNSDAVLP